MLKEYKWVIEMRATNSSYVDVKPYGEVKGMSQGRGLLLLLVFFFTSNVLGDEDKLLNCPRQHRCPSRSLKRARRREKSLHRAG